MFSNQKDKKVIYNGVKLSYDIALGHYQAPIRRNALFISDDNVLYPAGKHLINYELLKKKQSFLLKNYNDEPVSCMNYFRNKQTNVTLVAVGLKNTP